MRKLEIKRTKKTVSFYLIGDKKSRVSTVKFEETARVRFHRERFRKFHTLSVAGEPVSWKGKSKWKQNELRTALNEEGYTIQKGRVVYL